MLRPTFPFPRLERTAKHVAELLCCGHQRDNGVLLPKSKWRTNSQTTNNAVFLLPLFKWMSNIEHQAMHSAHNELSDLIGCFHLLHTVDVRKLAARTMIEMLKEMNPSIFSVTSGPKNSRKLVYVQDVDILRKKGNWVTVQIGTVLTLNSQCGWLLCLSQSENIRSGEDQDEEVNNADELIIKKDCVFSNAVRKRIVKKVQKLWTKTESDDDSLEERKLSTESPIGLQKLSTSAKNGGNVRRKNLQKAQ